MIPQVMAANAAGKLAQNKATPYVVGGIVLVALGLTYFGVVRPILCFTGIVSCKSDKLSKELVALKAFDPNYGNPALVTITHDNAKKIADDIYDAINWYNDKESEIYNSLQQAGSTHNLSLVSRMFAAKYNESMVEYISGRLNSDEMEKVQEIIKKYPK